MVLNCVLLIVGMFFLIKGADFFVSGASKIAKAMHIPSIIIGLTLVSIGTSMPEASVSVNASINNLNDMSLGNVVGSNIFNTLLILGASSIITPLVFAKDMKVYDIPIMIGIYVMLLVFGFVITPNVLNLLESIILLFMLVLYILFLLFRAKKDNLIEENKEEKSNVFKSCILTVLGLVLIIFGGDFVVDSASYISIKLGMSEALVGLTIVAVGTSLPELVTSVVASCKNEKDIAIGNVIGSNIFNVVFILGFSSCISSLKIASSSLVDVIVMIVSGVILLLITFMSKNMKRWHGVMFVLLYIMYLIFIIYRN